MLPHYKEEIINLKSNIEMLKIKQNRNENDSTIIIPSLAPAKVNILNGLEPFALNEGVALFTNHPNRKVNALAQELQGLQAFCFEGEQQRKDGTEIQFETNKPVTMLVGYFRDDHRRFAKAPKLEIDATANDYKQAEPLLTNAISIEDMPLANIHGYQFSVGKHKILLPKGYLIVLGFTTDQIKTRNVALEGTDDAVDWLFY